MGPSAGSGRVRPAPAVVVEGLRLLVVAFFAGAGYELGSGVGSQHVLGPLNGTAVGLVLGSGLGYVLGGVLSRTTASSADAARSHLHDTSAEELVAGGLGVVGGVLLGSIIALPAFFLRQAYLAFPLFAFVLVAMGYVGFLVGSSKRDGVLALFGNRAGLTAREPATAALPRVVDTSIAIDGRVLDVVRAGFLHGVVWVPTPVLAELQALADAGDDTRRAKGRRGLEVLEALRREQGIDVEVLEADLPAIPEVDAKLVRICLDRGAPLLTLDTNLAKAAHLAGVRVLTCTPSRSPFGPPCQPATTSLSCRSRPAGAEAGSRLPRRWEHGGG